MACLIISFSSLPQAMGQNLVQLSALQKQIENCGLQLPELAKISNYNQLYTAISNHYLLLRDQIIEREILYKLGDQNYKLKVNNDDISVFKIGEEDRLSPVVIDAKQKIKTTQGKIKQLTVNARIQEDWGQYFEQREKNLQIQYSIRNSKISQMKISNTKSKQILDCNLKNKSEVCYCLK